MILSPFFFAAICLNDHFSCCESAWKSTQLQHYPRCERTQHENQIHRLGSFLPFAADVMKVRFGAEATVGLIQVMARSIRATNIRATVSEGPARAAHIIAAAERAVKTRM
ncbi:hypothetical protein KUL25_10665 [Rhodobacteraceae bacterium N5(2021)]|uniref:Uncharacterized protein n=1 Tax=Gymnodinialimonas phycosphaerae TaxID=2841589 RepID=A0ABS7MTU3_9RHOB|nr:hypothetical protein [Gymnodinialimonas phycosphaerae]MBY4893226.1 hypothetical protein [Gymnodinialimonas phycosphaerae]